MSPSSWSPPTLLTLTLVLTLLYIFRTEISSSSTSSNSSSTSSGLYSSRAQQLIDSTPSAGLRHILARGASAPAWCKALAEKPRSQNNAKDCPAWERLNDLSNMKCGRFFSQYHQDVWVWQALARFMPGPGIYVDVGSNEPAAISNTYFLDRCLGWRGVCVEGQTRYHSKLREHRTCAIHSCASDKDETVEFVQAADLGGIASLNKNVNGTEDWQQRAKTAEKVMTHCMPVDAMLRQEGIDQVHYMSVDVEGAEEKVLKGIDFEKTHVALISMEGSKKGASDLLLNNGYTLISGGGDSFFVSNKMMQMIEKLKGKDYLQSIKVPTE